MVNVFPVDSIGRDKEGADFITLAGNHADKIAGGQVTFVYEDSTVKSAIVVAAFNNGAFTEVILPPGTLDFQSLYVTIQVYLPDPEPVEPQAERSLLNKVTLGLLGK